MISPTSYFGHLSLARLLLQRGMAAIYVFAFLSVLVQGKPLIGTRGLLPVPDFLEETTFRQPRVCFTGTIPTVCSTCSAGPA
jgi:hypothetical protein